MTSWPLSTVLVRMLWLRALCSVAEGASVTILSESCVAAVLRDAQKRLCSLGGRDGMPRSVGSVLGSLVARFLGGFRGKRCRSIPIGEMYGAKGMAISRDGTMLLMTTVRVHSPHAVHIYCVATGVHMRSIGCWGYGPLQFFSPCMIWIASDDFVFVADFYNHRIQVLTARFEFHGFFGVGVLAHPFGVCADEDVVAVSETYSHRISVFARRDGALLRRFGASVSVDCNLECPRALCFLGKTSCIAVASRNQVSAFTLDGKFVRMLLPESGDRHDVTDVAFRHVGNEIIAVAGNDVLIANGEMLIFTRVTCGYVQKGVVHGSTIFVAGIFFDKESRLLQQYGECLVLQ